jgi:hypothetical protein
VHPLGQLDIRHSSVLLQFGQNVDVNPVELHLSDALRLAGCCNFRTIPTPLIHSAEVQAQPPPAVRKRLETLVSRLIEWAGEKLAG